MYMITFVILKLMAFYIFIDRDQSVIYTLALWQGFLNLVTELSINKYEHIYSSQLRLSLFYYPI